MEHCVFCAFLSPGNDATNCGRPCDVHDVKLRDRTGVDHPLKADVGCRNTLLQRRPPVGRPVPAAAPRPRRRTMRIEFLDDDPASVTRIIGLYRDAIAGRRDAKTLWRELKATGQYGVTRGRWRFSREDRGEFRHRRRVVDLRQIARLDRVHGRSRREHREPDAFRTR